MLGRSKGNGFDAVAVAHPPADTQDVVPSSISKRVRGRTRPCRCTGWTHHLLPVRRDHRRKVGRWHPDDPGVEHVGGDHLLADRDGVCLFGRDQHDNAPRGPAAYRRQHGAKHARDFLGSFLFAIVGIIALSTGLYGETGRVILLVGTVAVIIFIVVTLLRWIEHITRFGRVSDTIDRVERAAIAAVDTIPVPLALGTERTQPDARSMTPVMPKTMARVTHVDVAVLGKLAEAIGADIHVLALPGKLVEPERPIALVAGGCDDTAVDKVRQAFTLSHHRTFDHDPRFGLVVLSEIASRALSPAVNDPGTAIAVIEASARVMMRLADHRTKEGAQLPARVHVPPIHFTELLDDWCRPIARDCAAIVEVGIRLQKALGALARHAELFRPLIKQEAHDAAERSKVAMTNERDHMLLEHTHYSHFAEPG
jgi:uncharacterized membrane protein